MELIDFSECERNEFRAYGGASGNKINIIYEGHGYMLKFPPKPGPISDLSYVNSCTTEYIACHVFQSMGIAAQETLLGTFKDSHGNVRNVVACKDFAEGNKSLVEFAHLKNTCLDSDQDGNNTDLDSIMWSIVEERLNIPDRRMPTWRQSTTADPACSPSSTTRGWRGSSANRPRSTTGSTCSPSRPS